MEHTIIRALVCALPRKALERAGAASLHALLLWGFLLGFWATILFVALIG